ncbi:MAG: flagellar filament outer layer protein FlaA [Spirochaetales bacterium]
MKRTSLLISALLLISAFGFAQNAATPAATVQGTTATPEVGAPEANLIGVDKAQQELKEISVSKFEDDGFWAGAMPRDDGFISLRRFEGSPADKKPIPGETAASIAESDKYVLGVKIQHLHRSQTQFEITPIRPLPIPGITKTISVWVVGRNVKHELYVMVDDQFGNHAKIPLGDLAFTGWKKLTAAIPPNIRQADPRYNNKQGIMVKSFLIETDPAETYGSYYIYLDDLRAVTDLFSENNRDADDMADAW